MKSEIILSTKMKDIHLVCSSLNDYFPHKNPIYTTEKKTSQARTNFGKVKILFRQGKDGFGCVNCDYLTVAFRVLGQRPDVIIVKVRQFYLPLPIFILT